MEKTRVPKGERYWLINYPSMIVSFSIEDYSPLSDGDFNGCNYFHSKEEAESMAEKIRKVLNGADVIEMPAYENEFESISEKYQSEYSNGEYCHEQSFSWGFQEGVDWLKSKIVK